MRCGFLLPPLLHLCEYIRVLIRRNYPCYRSHPRILLRLLSLRCQHSEWYHSLLLMLVLLVLPHPRLYITQIQRERAISSTLSRYSSSASFHLYVFHRHTVCTGIFYSSLRRLILLIYCVFCRSLFFFLLKFAPKSEFLYREKKEKKKLLLFRDFENKKITHQFFHTRQNFPFSELFLCS